MAALASAGRDFDSGDCAANEAVAQHDPEISGERGRRAEVSAAQEPKQDRCVRDEADRVALALLQMNNGGGEIAVLDALFEKIAPGGIVVLDDYEWAGVYREQKIKEDSWFDQKALPRVCSADRAGNCA